MSVGLILYFRAEDKLELRHTLEGHALGVVSVDINQQGTSILLKLVMYSRSQYVVITDQPILL